MNTIDQGKLAAWKIAASISDIGHGNNREPATLQAMLLTAREERAYLEAKGHEGVDLLEGLQGVALLRAQLVRRPADIQDNDCRPSATLHQIPHFLYLSCPNPHTNLSHPHNWRTGDETEVDVQRHGCQVSGLNRGQAYPGETAGMTWLPGMH